VTQTEGDRRFYAIVTDLTGTPAELVSADGELAGYQQHTLWGGTIWHQGGATTPLRFPGQYADQETGLHYNNHRYYDPLTGTYLTPDPLGLAPAPNPHGYVSNPHGYVSNPHVFADPLGLTPYVIQRLVKSVRRNSRLNRVWVSNKLLSLKLAGEAPAANATVRDLLDMRAGNEQFAVKAASAAERSDSQLLNSVFKPEDGDYMSTHPNDPYQILHGNHRAVQLMNRARDPNSSITWDTGIFIDRGRFVWPFG
jgi:RHS repeat-associated protein